jgi:hypothetical protein
MNFTQAAAAGLCDWSSFTNAPPNASASDTMRHVARYEYAASLVVKKEWGTGSYELLHNGRCAAAAEHYRMETALLRANGSTSNFGADIYITSNRSVK